MSEHAARSCSRRSRSARDRDRADRRRDASDPTDDAGEAAKDPGFAEKMNRRTRSCSSPRSTTAATPAVKHVLDTNLAEYIHKAVGVVGSRGIFGGRG
jgi:hypothetical protein